MTEALKHKQTHKNLKHKLDINQSFIQWSPFHQNQLYKFSPYKNFFESFREILFPHENRVVQVFRMLVVKQHMSLKKIRNQFVAFFTENCYFLLLEMSNKERSSILFIYFELLKCRIFFQQLKCIASTYIKRSQLK